MTDRAAGDVFLEFHRIGPYVKATAIDPESMVEVSVMGPPSAGEAHLARAAVRKLRFVLGRPSRRLEDSPPGSGRVPRGRGALA
jgi:hypothetical protein